MRNSIRNSESLFDEYGKGYMHKRNANNLFMYNEHPELGITDKLEPHFVSS